MNALASPTPRLLDDRSFPRFLSEHEGLVVVASHFGGWDVPWTALEDEAWAALRAEFGRGVALARIDTGQSRALAVRFGLEILPEVLLFARGRLVARLRGRLSAREILEAVHAARVRVEERESATQELVAQDSHRERPSAVRSVLRGRVARETASETALAHAG